MITTVIFDLDDTLYDEADYCASGFRTVARFLANAMKLPLWINEGSIFEALWAQFEAGNHTRTFNGAMDELGIAYDNEVIFTMIRMYREHVPDITLPEDSKEVLEKLGRRYKLAALSDGFLPAQQLKMQALEICHYFEHVMFTESLGRSYWKPHTKGFEMLLKKLGEKAASCVYVGDNIEKDFIAPNKLGMATIQVVRPHGVHQTGLAKEMASPGQIIASLSQLPAALKQIGSREHL